MPLSEREQAMLEQMEQALYAEDPRFAAQLASATPASFRRRRVVLGALGILVGLGIVLLGVMQQLVWVGVAGFLVMVAAGVYAFTSPRPAHLGAVQADGSIKQRRGATRQLRRPGAAQGQAKPRRSGTFMERMEQRWDDRRARGDF